MYCIYLEAVKYLHTLSESNIWWHQNTLYKLFQISAALQITLQVSPLQN